MLIGVAVLAAGVLAFFGWRAWPAPLADTVRDFDAAPELTWRFPLTPGESVTAINADEALTFTPGVSATEPVPINVVDLESGTLVWQTEVGEHAHQVGAYWVRPHNLPGTDFIVVKMLHSPPEYRTRHLLLDRKSGEIRHVLDTMSDTSLLTIPSGVPYLVDHVSAELSQLTRLISPDDRKWTIPAPELVAEDGAELQVLHHDGLVLVGPQPSRSYLPDENALWFVAAHISDGAPPPWATAAADRLFFLIDDVVVHLAPDQLRAVDQRGEHLWESPHPQLARRADDELFLIAGEPTSSLTLLNPRTGEPRWQTPPVLTPDTTVMAIGRRWLALSHPPGDQPRGVTVAEDGQLGESVQYPAGEQTQFFRGADRLYVTVGAPAETFLLAHRPGESHPMWLATFPAESQIIQPGRHLVLLDADAQEMRGLDG